MRSALNRQSTDINSFVKRPVSDVEIVLSDEFSLPEITSVIDILRRANALTRAQSGNGSHFNVSPLSSTGGTIISSLSIPVETEKTTLHQATNSTILLFIAGGTGAKQAASDNRLCKWLRQRLPMSTVAGPLSEGKLIPAANGLSGGLSGRYDVALTNPGIAGDIPWQDDSRTAASAIRTALQIPKEGITPSDYRFNKTRAVQLAGRGYRTFRAKSGALILKFHIEQEHAQSLIARKLPAARALLQTALRAVTARFCTESTTTP